MTRATRERWPTHRAKAAARRARRRKRIDVEGQPYVAVRSDRSQRREWSR